MGNCSKVPRTSSHEEIKANPIPSRNNPAPSSQNPRAYQANPSNPNYQSNPSYPSNQNIPNQASYGSNQGVPQHPFSSNPPSSGYRPSPPNLPNNPYSSNNQGRAPPAAVPGGPPGGPPGGYAYPQPYPAQPGPVPGLNQNSNSNLMIAETKSVSRLCRIIEDKLTIVEDSDKLSWINFRYKSLYPAKATIHYFVREGFDRNSRKHYFFANPDTFPKAKSYELVEGENVEFVNKYKTSFNNVPDALLEVRDKITYPIVVEIECKSRDNRTDEQVCINCYKISKEGGKFVSSIVKQIVRINGNYRTLTNLYGTSANDDESECLICLTERKNVAVLPCRHVIYCETCMNEIAKKSKNECPICRTAVSSFLKVHQ